MIKYEEWKDKKKDFFKVDVRHVQGNFFPGLQRRAMTLKAGAVSYTHLTLPTT